MTLMRESLVLAAVCLADLLSTLVLVGHQHASEGNPLMGYYLQLGIGVFILVKLMLVVLPVFILEWSKQFVPTFARRVVRIAIVAYIGIYAGLFLGVNIRPLFADSMPTQPPVEQHVLHMTKQKLIPAGADTVGTVPGSSVCCVIVLGRSVSLAIPPVFPY